MKYIALICATIAVFFAIMAHVLNSKLTTAEKNLSLVKAEKTALETQLEKEHNDKVELDKQYKKLEAKAKSDKDFNWYADISNSPVVVELHD